MCREATSADGCFIAETWDRKPFDLLGFLDYAPADEAAFEDMLGLLRASIEWNFMDREIDIRLLRDHA